MTGAPRGLAALVDAREAIPAPAGAPAAVTELVSAALLSPTELRPYIAFRADKYARNLVHRSELFDVIVLCWRPGQVTPVHDHSGQHGWVRVLESGAARRVELAFDSQPAAT